MNKPINKHIGSYKKGETYRCPKCNNDYYKKVVPPTKEGLCLRCR